MNVPYDVCHVTSQWLTQVTEERRSASHRHTECKKPYFFYCPDDSHLFADHINVHPEVILTTVVKKLEKKHLIFRNNYVLTEVNLSGESVGGWRCLFTSSPFPPKSCILWLLHEYECAGLWTAFPCDFARRCLKHWLTNVYRTVRLE